MENIISGLDLDRILTSEVLASLKEDIILSCVEDPFLCDDIKLLIRRESITTSTYKNFEIYRSKAVELVRKYYKAHEKETEFKGNLDKYLRKNYNLFIREKIMYVANVSRCETEEWDLPKKTDTGYMVILLFVILFNISKKVVRHDAC